MDVLPADPTVPGYYLRPDYYELLADLRANGVWEIDGARLKVVSFLRTGADAHGLYPSRDARLLYVSNRNDGTISVVSFATGKVVTQWPYGHTLYVALTRALRRVSHTTRAAVDR